MNDKLKAALQVGLAVAGKVFPEAAPATEVASAVLDHDHPDAVSVESDVLNAAEAAFKTIENMKHVDIGNEATFKAGCLLVEQGYNLIHASLIDHTDGTPHG